MAPLGGALRGAELIRLGGREPVRFLAADEGKLTRTATETLGSGRGFRQVVELEWVLMAEPGDALIDAAGREFRVLGYAEAQGAEVRTALPRALHVDALPATTPLVSLSLSVEAASALKARGLRTLGELAATSDAELLRTKRVNRRLQKELARLVASASRRRSISSPASTSRCVVWSVESLRSPFRLELPRLHRVLTVRSTGPRDPLLRAGARWASGWSNA